MDGRTEMDKVNPISPPTLFSGGMCVSSILFLKDEVKLSFLYCIKLIQLLSAVYYVMLGFQKYNYIQNMI